MNTLKLLPILGAVMLLTTCTGQLMARLSSPYSVPEGSSRAERRILVTFVDRSINRVPFGNPANPYRQRGDYRSSTWSR
jgi:hypothetical protein